MRSCVSDVYEKSETDDYKTNRERVSLAERWYVNAGEKAIRLTAVENRRITQPRCSTST